MKRLLCAILTLVCIMALCSCDMPGKVVSTEPEANPTTTTPSANPETTVPQETTLEVTTPEETTPEITVPEETSGSEPTSPEPPVQTTPEQTTPEDNYPCDTTPDETSHDLTEPIAYITVHVVFQSGGIHRIEDKLVVEDDCTFVQLYSAFVQMYDLMSFSIIPYLNGELIDTAKTIYLQDGDSIYLEEYSGMPGEEPVCPHKWMDGSCTLCGSTCTHSEWNDMGQCIVCGFWMGVNLIEIEIYENGEYKAYTQVDQITLLDIIIAYYGYPWEYMVDSYEFYHNGMLITDSSYLITESGRVDIVTRGWSDDPNKPSDDPNDNPQGGKDPENTTATDDNPTVPDAETITVQITYQTGGVHRVESVITTTSPATLLEVYNLFANEHPYEMFNNVQCSLNGKPIDPNQTIYMQNGDKIYLQEDGNGYHLHIWEMGMGRCRTCMEECSHEWEGNVCRVCKLECYHDYWNGSQCGICGMMCEHREWDSNRQCLVCGSMLGVDLLQIEIYENGEQKYNANGSIETTVRDLLLSCYGYYPWEYLESNYEFYFNGMLVDGSYWITEHGILNLVTPGGDTGDNPPSNPENPETPDVTHNISYSILYENGEYFQGEYPFSEPKELAYLLSDAGYYIDFGLGYRVTVNGELIEDSYGKGAYFLMIDQSCVVTVEPTIKILVKGYNEVFYAAESENLCFYDVAKYYGIEFDDYFWCCIENEALAGEEMVTKLHYGDYNHIHEIKLHERKIVFHIEVINRYGDVTIYCTPELNLTYGVTLQEVIDAYSICGVDYMWEMIDVEAGYVSSPIDFSYIFELPLMFGNTYVCENNGTYLLRATSVHFAPDGSGGWN